MTAPGSTGRLSAAAPPSDSADPAHPQNPPTRSWPGRILQVTSWLAALWGLAVLDQLSQSGSHWLFETLLSILALVLAMVWLGFLTFSRRAKRAPIRHRMAAPIILGLGMIATDLMPNRSENPLFRLRFELSRPALTSVATAIREGGPDDPRSVGVFPIQWTESHEGAVWFITSSCGILCSCGLGHSPALPPEVLDDNDATDRVPLAWYFGIIDDPDAARPAHMDSALSTLAKLLHLPASSSWDPCNNNGFANALPATILSSCGPWPP